MSNKLLPKKSYSALDLVNLKLPGMPTSKKGWYARVRRDNWEAVFIPDSGKGCKGGLREEFIPPHDVQIVIEALYNDAVNNGFYLTPELQRKANIEANQARHDYKKDTLYIEHFVDVRAAAGAGQITPTDQVVVTLKVNAADWNKYVGLDHRHIKIITVHGDSMKPTLTHGDHVMVDTACNQFIDDAIYCIRQGDNLRFKRIHLRLDGSIVVKSDNNNGDFPFEEYPASKAAEFNVIGRVIPIKYGMFEI